ncbi:sentrin-specific protease 1-like [Amblyomma americanum]
MHSQDTSHWVLAVVYFRTPEMVIYDSLGQREEHAESIDALAQYPEEVSHLRDCELDWRGWHLYTRIVPLQKNTRDSAVFMSRYAQYLTRDAQTLFEQKHIPHFRNLTVYEILHHRLLPC